MSNYFKYPKEIRKIIYTTNIIEGFHRQLRSVTKSKGAFTSEEALMKLLFLAQEDICSKWNRPAHNWNQTLSQLGYFVWRSIEIKNLTPISYAA